MKTQNLIIALSAATALQASAAPIPSLYNTGVDSFHTVLPDSNPGDPHYKLTSIPGGTPNILVRSYVGGYPVNPYYIADNSLSAWIGPNNDHSLNGPKGNYTYSTTFDLTGFNPSTAMISGQWATDDVGVQILLNGNVVAPGGAGMAAFVPFTIPPSGFFVAGLNTLDFVVLNTLQLDYSPTALRVEMRGEATPVPEPSTYLAGLSALGMLGFFGWRNRK